LCGGVGLPVLCGSWAEIFFRLPAIKKEKSLKNKINKQKRSKSLKKTAHDMCTLKIHF
jgi:hypothetical protein